MTTPRSINNIIDSLRSGLRDISSPLADFSPFSNIYALFRSMAILIAEQDINLYNLGKSFYISTATGEDLDLRVGDLGLSRHPGTYSNGFALASGGTPLIESGLILSTADQTLQYEVTDTVPIYGETSIPVRAINRGSIYNLSAGTRLYSASLPSTTFTVGAYRDTTTRSPIVSISGGTDEETDADLRNRASQYLRSLGLGTKMALNTYIREYVSGRSYIKEHFPVTGYITVYIDTEDARVRDNVEQLINNIKAAGVAYIVRPLTSRKESVSLLVTTNSPELSQSIIDETKRRVMAYGDSLGLGSTLHLNTIAGLVMSIEGVINCRVIRPEADVAVGEEVSVGVDSVIVDLRTEQ